MAVISVKYTSKGCEVLGIFTAIKFLSCSVVDK